VEALQILVCDAFFYPMVGKKEDEGGNEDVL
jgi:hypothetical protein